MAVATSSTHQHLAPLHPLLEKVYGYVSSSSLIQSTTCLAGIIFQQFVRRPFAFVYLNAPVALGGWDGRSAEDICAQITGSSATFWLSSNANMEECHGLIERKFNSWYSVVVGGMYFWLLYQFVTAVMGYTARKITRGAPEQNKPLQIIFEQVPPKELNLATAQQLVTVASINKKAVVQDCDNNNNTWEDSNLQP